MNILYLVLTLFLVNHNCLTFARKKKDDDCSESDESNEDVGCFPKKSTIPHANLVDYCKNIYSFDTAVSVTPTKFELIPIPSCLSCDMRLRTTQNDKTVTATFNTLGIRGDPTTHCQEIRLDIFDGWTPSDDTLLSNKNGICGSNLPHQTFQSSNNTLTIRLRTSCEQRHSRFGTFDIIVAATKKANLCMGQFKCTSGQCLGKNFVCDGYPQCPDHSDENGCRRRPGHGIPAWLVAILVIIAVALFILFLVTICLTCFKNLCYSGYTRV